ncbi:ABC transporter ATP-binding protein [Leucobacter chromiiresistens]|uniref:ABC-type cobalamin/Fe3+-siderophores transport system, ATPase component n=1 Tax=Leucobacter chromiiresistens TaxID=1079994 RepID=A0A1H0ZJM3_9MICO|nr:ATP-binding cassette domain-containing protein [Leucobacter chromiiresistens]SDQ27685.1 ABC-type cobalamin/Fe3+-siderophores transport system, ATPase component [Leucobacter chromiiresistens]
MIVVADAEVREHDVTLLPATSFEVRAGEAVVVRGANGVGKSTLLRVLAGMRVPTSGRVGIGGLAPHSRDRRVRRLVAAMIGLPPMAADLTVRDHVLLVAVTWSSGRAESDAEAGRIADGVLDELGLAPLAARFPHELSSGQTQLFGLALLLARPCEALLLDEPEQRLDADRIGTVVDAVNRRREAGAAVVVTTHSDALEAGIGGRTVWLRGAA